MELLTVKAPQKIARGEEYHISVELQVGSQLEFKEARFHYQSFSSAVLRRTWARKNTSVREKDPQTLEIEMKLKIDDHFILPKLDLEEIDFIFTKKNDTREIVYKLKPKFKVSTQVDNYLTLNADTFKKLSSNITSKHKININEEGWIDWSRFTQDRPIEFQDLNLNLHFIKPKGTLHQTFIVMVEEHFSVPLNKSQKWFVSSNLIREQKLRYSNMFANAFEVDLNIDTSKLNQDAMGVRVIGVSFETSAGEFSTLYF